MLTCRGFIYHFKCYLLFFLFLKGEMSKIPFVITNQCILDVRWKSIQKSHYSIVTDVGTCIAHKKVKDMTDSQPPTPRALCFQSWFRKEAQNQLLLPNITDESSSYWIESNLFPPKIHQKIESIAQIGQSKPSAFHRHGVCLHKEELQPLSASIKRFDMGCAWSVFLFSTE